MSKKSLMTIFVIMVFTLFYQGKESLDAAKIGIRDNTAPVQSKTYELDVTKKIVAFYSFVGNSDYPEMRNMNEIVVNEGWQAYKEQRVDIVLEGGWTRIWLHNPFGRSDGEVMEYCQYLEALRHQPAWMATNMTNEFVDVWKPLIQSGIEVTMYLGGPHQDDEMIPLEGDTDLWWDHAFKCLDPLFQTGVTSFGIDNSGPRLPGTPTHWLADWWKLNRGPVTVEARPHVGTAWLDGYKVAAKAETWDLQAPELHDNQVGRHAFEWEFNGEVLELIETEIEDKEKWTLTKQALREGHTVLTNAQHVIHPAGDNMKSLDNFLRHMDVDIAQRIDLFPGAPNANTGLTFTIIDGPHFGRLEPMWFDPTGSVFLYTPSLYFSGTDVITFKVNDGQQEQQETITINVSGLSGRRGEPPTYVNPLRVFAGEDRSWFAGFQLLLEGSVVSSDASIESLNYLWSKVSGPGELFFGTPTSLETSALASSPGTYVIRLTASDGHVSHFNDLNLTVVGLDHLNGQGIPPNSIEVKNNVIHPARQSRVVFHVQLRQAESSQFEVLDMAGRGVAVLLENTLGPGTHSISWDGKNQNGTDVAAGTYLLVARIGGQTFTEKMSVLR